MIKKLVLAAVIGAMSLSIVACGSNSEKINEPAQETTVTREAVDSNGTKVTVPVNPERVVDLSGSSDILSLLGFNIVGTCNSDGYDYTKLPTYLEDTLKDATILGYSMVDTVDVEAILGLNPDLIIISKVQEAAYEQLSQIAPTLVINLEMLDMKTDFRAVAKIMDREEEAKAWLDSYDAKTEEVSKLVKETLGEDATYLSFLASGGSNFINTNATFGNLIYDDLGLKRPENLPVQEDMTLPVVTNEGLAEIDPDYMFIIATDDDKAALEKDAIFKNLRAVKEGHVVISPASPYFNQGYSPIGRMVFLDELISLADKFNK